MSLAARRIIASDATDATRLVTVGPPSATLDVRIVDPESGIECAADAVGEIWIAGGSVAAGYWQREAESSEVFGARLAGVAESFLRTGDLGTMHQGELVVTGRLKDLVIVGGRNVYPQDIESAAETSHAHIRSGAVSAFSTGLSGHELIVVVAEVARHHRVTANLDVIGAVRSAVANALGVTVSDVVLIRQGMLPKTSSGKLQRRRTRELYEARALAMVASDVVPVAASGVTSAERSAGIRTWLREYARHRLDSRGMDERREMSPDVTRDFAAKGLFGLQAPVELGGLGLTHGDAFRVIEQLASIDLTLATFVGGHNSLGIRPLLQHAAHPLRDALVPTLARGERIAALALTEPAAGSNPWAIESLAVPTEGGWHLHGTKSWIGSAGVAGVFNVFARIPGDDGGITAFVVGGGHAWPAGRRGGAHAWHARDAAEHRPSEWRVRESRRGARRSRRRHARGAGDLSPCALRCRRDVSRRNQAGDAAGAPVCVAAQGGLCRLLDHPATRARLGGMAASAAALDTYLALVADALDTGTALPEDAFIICKTAAPELLWDAADSAVQLLGGRGYVENNPAAQLFRDARLLRIFEGPTEPLLVHLGTRALRDATAQRTLLTQRLGAPDIAEQLARVAEQAAERLSAHGATRAASHQWAALLLGRAVTEGVMLAAARISRTRGTSGCDLAIAQFEERFEAALIRCGTARADERAALLGQNLESAVAWANESVGDVEQRTNAALDPMLAAEWTGSSVPVERVEQRDAAEARSSSSLSFILEWLSHEFQLAPGAAGGDTDVARPRTRFAGGDTACRCPRESSRPPRGCVAALAVGDDWRVCRRR